MIVYDHAVQNYIKRVLGIETSQAGENVEQFAKDQIKLAVRTPDTVYNREKDGVPVHIRNGVAAIVDKSRVDEMVIPTVYNSVTFNSKMDQAEDVATA